MGPLLIVNRRDPKEQTQFRISLVGDFGVGFIRKPPIHDLAESACVITSSIFSVPSDCRRIASQAEAQLRTQPCDRNLHSLAFRYPTLFCIYFISLHWLNRFRSYFEIFCRKMFALHADMIANRDIDRKSTKHDVKFGHELSWILFESCLASV
jgi:hypothetical protein